MGAPATIYRAGKRVFERLAAPLRTDDSMKQFTLAVPDAQTTTVDSVQGWRDRPPALLECPGCESQILQSESIDAIDCPTCWRDFPAEEFDERKLVAMVCPRCESEMDHGIRHPKLYDIPEWATCPECRYHWDLDHWY
jgi:hypothetical protein